MLERIYDQASDNRALAEKFSSLGLLLKFIPPARPTYDVGCAFGFLPSFLFVILGLVVT